MNDNDFIFLISILGILTILISSFIHGGNIYFQSFLIILVLAILIIFNWRLNILDRFKINKLSKKANGFLINEDYDDALLIYDEILELNSTDISALYYKSHILFNKNQFLESLDLLNFLLENQKILDAVLLKGRILIYLDNIKEGLDCYKESLSMDDFDLEKYLDEIVHFGDPIRFKNNNKMLETSLALCNIYLENDDNSFVLYYKAYALSQLGRLEESLDTFGSVLKLDPGHIFTYSTESEILFANGRYDEALDLINQGLELYPDGKLNYNKALILFRLDEFDEAFNYINKFLDSVPDDERGMELKRNIEEKLSS